MTLTEWIAKYEQKTGDKFEPKNGFKLFYLPERGFCEIRADAEKQMIMLWQMCGDGHFWVDHAMLIAAALGYTHIGAISIRDNVNAYIRFGGFKVDHTEILPDGNKRYCCVGKDGKRTGLVSPAWIDKDGNMAYFLTWEVEQQ